MIALVLAIGYSAATTIAAAPFCTLPHHGTETTLAWDKTADPVDVETSGSESTTPAEGASRPGPESNTTQDAGATPHDHAPDTPPVSGTGPCVVTLLATTASTIVLPSLEKTHGPVFADQPAPESADSPPPYEPPRA